uniref:PPE family protein n=1 Tax=Acrobeloides nanus TaxID=290746 RepID=A0A914CVI0_9BILA
MSIIGINLGFNPSSIVGFNLLGGLDPFGSGGGSSVNLFQIFLQIINMFLGVSNSNDVAIGAFGKKENIGNLGGKFPLVGNGNSILGGSISQGNTPTGAGNLGIFGSPNPLGGILGRR